MEVCAIVVHAAALYIPLFRVPASCSLCPENMYGHQGTQQHPSGTTPSHTLQGSQPRESQGRYGSTQEGISHPNAFGESEVPDGDVFGIGFKGSGSMQGREGSSRKVSLAACSVNSRW